jgi:hypothetical protein
LHKDYRWREVLALYWFHGWVNMPKDDVGKYHDEPVGNLADFDMRQFTHSDIAMNDAVFKIEANGLIVAKRLTELPYVFSAR